MKVNGRHTKGNFQKENIISDYSISEDGVTIRLDDKENLDWWLEVFISKEELKEMHGNS